MVALYGRTDGPPVIHMHKGAGGRRPPDRHLDPRRGAVTPSTGWGRKWEQSEPLVLSLKAVSAILPVEEWRPCSAAPAGLLSVMDESEGEKCHKGASESRAEALERASNQPNQSALICKALNRIQKCLQARADASRAAQSDSGSEETPSRP